MVVLAIINSLYLHRQNQLRARLRRNGEFMDYDAQGDKSVHFKYIT